MLNCSDLACQVFPSGLCCCSFQGVVQLTSACQSFVALGPGACYLISSRCQFLSVSMFDFHFSVLGGTFVKNLVIGGNLRYRENNFISCNNCHEILWTEIRVSGLWLLVLQHSYQTKMFSGELSLNKKTRHVSSATIVWFEHASSHVYRHTHIYIYIYAAFRMVTIFSSMIPSCFE